MRNLQKSLLFLSMALLPVIAHAQPCPGDPGFTLTIDPPTVPIGTTFDITMNAPGSSFALLILSSSPGPTKTEFGDLCIGPSIAGVVPFTLVKPNVKFPHFVPCDPSYPGIFGHMQFLAVDTLQPSLVRVSNSASLSVVTNSCGTTGFAPGDLVTFIQLEWGGVCPTNPVACLRDTHFPAVLPAGLILGDQDGPDVDLFFATHLTSSLAVENLLPTAGPAAVFTLDRTDPLTTSSGAFAGELAAAKLNVQFDDAGIFDPLKGLTTIKLKTLVFVANVQPTIRGYSISEIIFISDMVISGELPAPVDLNGDSIGDVSEQDLSDALEAFNRCFADGLVNLGTMGLP